MSVARRSRFAELLRQLQEEHERSLRRAGGDEARIRPSSIPVDDVVSLGSPTNMLSRSVESRISPPGVAEDCDVTFFSPSRPGNDEPKIRHPDAAEDDDVALLDLECMEHVTNQNGGNGLNSMEPALFIAKTTSSGVATVPSHAPRKTHQEEMDMFCNGFLNRSSRAPQRPRLAKHESVGGFDMQLFHWWAIFYSKYTIIMQYWETLEEPDLSKSLVGRLVTSHTFSLLSFGVIIFDTLVTASSLNYTIETREETLPSRFQVVNTCVLIYYMLELALKVIAYGRYFLISDDMKWNCLDLFLVIMACMDTLLEHALEGSRLENLSFMRMLRLIRLMKLFRLVRILRFLKDQALVFVQATSSYLIDHAHDTEDEEHRLLVLHFGSVQDSMLTLFQCSSGGIDWMDVYKIISLTWWVYSAAFIFFIVFFNLAVLSILTGVFVEKALVASQPDRDAQALEQRRLDDRLAKELLGVLESMDADRSGTINLEEFDAKMSEEHVQAFFAMFGLRIQDAKMFFSFLRRCTGEDDIPIDEFLYRCVKMKGLATSMDLHGMACEVSKIHEKLIDVCNAAGIAQVSVPRRSMFFAECLSMPISVVPDPGSQ